MPAASRTLFDDANPGRDQLVAKSDRIVAKGDHLVAFDEQCRALCRSIWPGRTTAPQLAINGDVEVRQAQRILAREQGFSLAVIRSLLHSPFGASFFDLLMQGSQADWARDTLQERRMADLRKRRRELEKQLKALEEA